MNGHYKLKYEYKDLCKDIFIDGYVKQSDIVKNCKNIFRKIEELKPYVIEFKKEGIMKSKTYFFNCKVRSDDHQPINIITHNKYIICVNNRVQRA